MKRILSCLLAACLILALAGCGAQQPNPEVPADTLEERGDLIEDGESRPPIKECTVSSVEELLESVGTDTYITVAAGKYNLTDFLSAVDVEQWNALHRFVKLEERFDGYEVVIRRVDGLVIRGETENMADTELVTDPRYAAVLHFDDCRELGLYDLTMGHTDRGECVGSVLQFDDCQDVSLDHLDLYGCGVYGVSACRGTARLWVSGCTLRDCSYGPIEIYDCRDCVYFMDCTMTGSASGGYFEPSEDYTLHLWRCTLGQQESNYWTFDEDADIQDCTMMEPTVYPEYGYGD